MRTPIRRGSRAATPIAAGALAVGLLAGACAAGGASAQDDDRVHVVVSSYPLQYVAERVGGARVDVVNLTPPSSDPHGLELTVRDAADLAAADLVVHLPGGFQPAADAAVADVEPGRLLDATDAADLRGEDPHFWLDPTRLAAVGDAVADRLAAIDPDAAPGYRADAAVLAADLVALDERYAAALAPCAGATLVTSHQAFGYLAERYGLHQVGVVGVDPEVEPSPARLREVAELVEQHGVRTLYFERAAGPGVTSWLAERAGVGTAVIDPVESHGEDDPDYLEAMGANLDALVGGLACQG
ncbi:zinc ABC transporter substrate-binding protein [Cellulomonas sp. DKR-3]|uniref:Zinc ABC transporter substrate-binding protein n=1 Tax=Cellulomonas fulva TaxID=2835530 RepID=A0ABS5U047_9CELL|nr:metal ABC transporter substrate-binding protein [Cellulomonas fulva]MBT0994783.1 zinc ABC transporter substrate-binding protein [Cellulomonas fulva]